jgi:predicted RNA-binding protein with PIN domain
MPYWFDGNNLIGLSASAARADKRSRTAFLSALSGWRGAGGGRFLVWFDGDDPADMRPPPGVTVRYSAPVSADAAICRRLREIERPGEIIVVTNDRELSSRCRNAGANILDWNRFTLKMQARSDAPRRAAEPAAKNAKYRRSGEERKINQAFDEVSTAVDVDDWLRFFGISE